MKKEKFILHAVGNEGNFNYYIVDKKEKVALILSQMFSKVFNLYWDFYEIDSKGTRKINVEKYVDFHETIGNSNKIKSRIDIFYGNKKMFFSIHCSEKLRLKFNEELFNIFKMPKPKKSAK